MDRVLLAFLTFLALSAQAMAGELSPTWRALSQPEAPKVFKVLQLIDSGKGDALVLLAGGVQQGLVKGEVFKTYRMSGPGGAGGNSILWIQTGRLKAVEVQDELTVAAVESQGSPLASAIFPKFPGLMGGDLAAPEQLKLERRQALMPIISLSYSDLFADPKSTPSTFELKVEGLTQLKSATKDFASTRLSMLMIEGYTDHNGPANANQVESYQRAMTVRQYLIDELGFDPKRVVAIGYGEAEPADQSLAPGYIEANRRIVLKAIPLE